MVIYGVALLSICMMIGIILGDVLGNAIGIDANVGGIGIAMLLLVLIVDAFRKRERLSQPTQEGLSFWSAMYIPIVVAMAANQNVAGAIEGGQLHLSLEQLLYLPAI
ncbi:malonate transporter subunit MadL [Salicibibacter cibi]|uniref:malonate transporter subunit MadL n=1 Tax=Salicibibacter cibi TaxID=2743001 RepID=UPI0031B61DB6